MIITCPACSTQYTVPPDAIPAEGRTVKCTSCSHMWEQMPVTLEGIAAPIKTMGTGLPGALPKNSNLPAKAKIPFPPASPALKVATLLLFLLAGFFSFMTHPTLISEKLPFTTGIYNALGLFNTRDIAFNDMRAQVSVANNKLAVSVTGKVANESGYNRLMQPVHIYILSGGGNVMGKVAYEEGKGQEMPPESFQPFKSNIANVSGNTERIVMDIGNWLERMFR